MTDPDLALNDGHSMPQLGFGLWEVPSEDTARVVADGIAAGYRLIDGAAIYGNEQGLGEGLRRSGCDRSNIFVTSKVWNSEHGYDAALRAIDASLERIGIDHLDLCLIHWPCADLGLFVDTWRALIAAREAGKAISIGVSNFLPPHLDRITGETGVVPVVNQIELHPELQQAESRAAHAAHGIVTQAWTPLGQSRAFAAPAVAQAAERCGKSPAQVILRWHVQLENAVIPRSTNAGRLAENRALFDFELTDDEMGAIDGLDSDHRTGPHPDTFGN